DRRGRENLVLDVPADDILTTSPVGYTKDGSKVFLLDSRDRNTAALFLWDPETDEKTLLAENDKADIAGIVKHPTLDMPEAVQFNYEKNEYEVLDEEFGQNLAVLKSQLGEDVEISITSRSLDDTTWIIAAIASDAPVKYYKFDNESDELSYLFSNRKSLEGLPLVKMHPRVIQSRDGLNLVSYLTTPGDANDDGIPDAGPMPMVLLVHGGPWARDSFGYNSLHQWLANRGYAVLSVNYRGSTGFGKDFTNAGNREWAGKMHDDLIDAVNWAVAEGIADKDQVAIMGGSYGGYATLVGVTFTPDVFAAGVDIVGPSNLVTLMETIPPYWVAGRKLWQTRLGDVDTEEGRAFLMSRSPITKVDQIKVPLLIGQGANDPRVKQAESDQIVSAMQERNIPVTYVLYPDEGHGFARPENRMSFFGIAENFLAEHLGGRAQPLAETDVEGSSITVPAGAQDIDGLPGLLSE
ncbi:MAG: S9 family peptidase, partial [Planctomycetota bacterium]